jgi:hypothetical protein
MRKPGFILPAAVAGMALAAIAAPAAQAAVINPAMYDSTPVAGTVSVPSVGAEAYSFNQIGNEVILRPHTHAIKHMTVTMESWACQHGSWSDASCLTTPGSTFQAPLTLNLYRYAHVNPTTGVTTPGKLIMSVTKTFAIHYRPSSIGGGESRFMGADHQLHNGIAQNVSFPVNRNLGTDVVWTIGYNTDNSGFAPLHGSGSPMDSLNVGLAPKVRVGHDRFPTSIFWDTRYAGNTGGAPFVTGTLNKDTGWAGYVPAARFSTR